MFSPISRCVGNTLCEVIATYDLKDFEAEKKSIEEKRQELHTAISERKNQLKVLLTQKVKDLSVAAGNEELINETYDSLQQNYWLRFMVWNCSSRN